MSAKVQVLSCGCICRTYDGKIVVVNASCDHHRVHTESVRQAIAASGREAGG